MLNGKSLDGQLFIRRIPMEEVPEKDEEAAEWLQKLYQQKVLCLNLFFVFINYSVKKTIFLFLFCLGQAVG